MYNVNHCNWVSSKGLPVVVHTVTYRKFPRFFFFNVISKFHLHRKHKENTFCTLSLSFIPSLIVFLSPPSLSSCLALPEAPWVLEGPHEYMASDAQSHGKVESFLCVCGIRFCGTFLVSGTLLLLLICFFYFPHSLPRSISSESMNTFSLQKLWVLLSRPSLRTEWKLKEPHISPRPPKLCCCVQWKDERKTVVYTGAMERNSMRS